MSCQIEISDLSKNYIIIKGHIFWFKNQRYAEKFRHYAMINAWTYRDPHIAHGMLVYQYNCLMRR